MLTRFVLVALLGSLASACGANATNQSSNAATTGSVVSPTAAPATGKVNTRSADGLILVGTLLPAAKPNSPGLLLLHQWQSDRHSYDEFAKRMQARGFNVLAIDGRGFGESTKTMDGKTAQAERTEAAVQAMLGDVDAAYKFLADQPNVDKNKIGIVGASYASSLALIYAADHPNVAAVALLSPGLNYFGNMATEPVISRYGQNRPLLLVSAKDDSESDDTVNTLLKHMANDAKWGFTSFPSGGHGTALFKVGLADNLEKFFTESLQQ